MSSLSERLLIEEVIVESNKMQVVTRGLPIGALIKTIRKQLGMSQTILAKRAKVPQSTVSRIEQGKKDINLSTLQKLLHALSGNLVIVPAMQESIESIRHRQAKLKAKDRINYLLGTMNLEGQQPDSQFVENLLIQEQQRLLHGPKSKLWEE